VADLRIVFFSCLPALAVAQACTAQALWTGPSGGGLASIQEARVLEPGHFAFGLVVDNYDRDPLGLDAFDVRIDWRLAVVHRLELYGRYQISRSVSTPGYDPVPSPPLDIVSLGPSAAPRAPYRALYWPMPYLAHHGARVDDMIPGEYSFGVRVQVAYQRGWRPLLAVNAELSVPGDMASWPLQKGSGTGSLDGRLSGAATWEYRRLSVSLNAGYTKSGDLERSDRLIVQGIGGSEVTEERIRRPDLLEGGLGVRYALRRGLSAFAEVAGWEPVGSHTPTFSSGGATDVLAGVQIAVKGVCLTAGYRQHLKPPPDGAVEPTGPLAGGLDLSAMSDAAQGRYLASLGIDPQLHRPGTSLVVVDTPPGRRDPRGSQRIPDTHLSHTTGNGGVVLAVSFSF
jgi:hypothetical protein